MTEARRTVAVIVETSGSYGRAILAGVARFLRTHGLHWSILVDERELGAAAPRWLSRSGADGIICRPMTRPLAEKLLAKDLPAVDLNDQFEGLGLPHIWSDMRAIGRRAAEHLLERGFRRLAYCGFRDETWSELRRAGFEEALSRRGLGCDVYVSPWRGLRARPWSQEHEALARWLRGLPRPLAVMACNDVRAQHVIDAARSVGLSMPEELAVVGVDDDYPLCDLCDPPLSSVVPNAPRIGYEAASLLERLMSGERPQPVELLVEPLGVVTRQSTDILAVDDPLTAAALRHIRERACDGLKVPQLLRHVAISRPVLERRFRKYLDRSPQAENPPRPAGPRPAAPAGDRAPAEERRRAHRLQARGVPERRLQARDRHLPRRVPPQRHPGGHPARPRYRTVSVDDRPGWVGEVD